MSIPISLALFGVLCTIIWLAFRRPDIVRSELPTPTAGTLCGDCGPSHLDRCGKCFRCGSDAVSALQSPSLPWSEIQQRAENDDTVAAEIKAIEENTRLEERRAARRRVAEAALAQNLEARRRAGLPTGVRQ